MAPKKVKGPQFIQYFVPLLDALKALGGSGRPSEVRDHIAEQLKLPESERALLNESGQARFDNHVHWARFYLARAGYIESTIYCPYRTRKHLSRSTPRPYSTFTSGELRTIMSILAPCRWV
ncbi:winged helix-turn-helix domain-containing protein [Candidatus Chloroploca asiatica]|uniref:winged helix-turn-helix domain-containing protein n=1 Tax=Candidatus Chloroploca asiatica TaxID=1506545 RepID=UPI000BE8DC90|nr:winged helix-turn-helix domain-containing protein [Candidatus Chloroploca asiatica]